MFYSSAVSPVVRLEAVAAPGTASARAVRRAVSSEPGPGMICALA